MNKHSSREQFGTNAAAYIDSQTHARGASLARLVELTRPRADWLVLDIATGAGHTAFAFAPHVARVWATDITPEMLSAARRLAEEKGLGNVQTGYAEADNLPYRPGRFNLVTCRIAAHHFQDIPAFLAEAHRVLLPGGTLAVVDNIVPQGPAGDYVNALEKLRDPSHLQCWSLARWAETIAGLGFENLQTERQEKALQFEFWAQRHGPIMLSYLRAILMQAPGEAGRFLHPEPSQAGTSFHLQEGIFVANKPFPGGGV
jgi:SAM-dependent methyltransferase